MADRAPLCSENAFLWSEERAKKGLYKKLRFVLRGRRRNSYFKQGRKRCRCAVFGTCKASACGPRTTCPALFSPGRHAVLVASAAWPLSENVRPWAKNLSSPRARLGKQRCLLSILVTLATSAFAPLSSTPIPSL